MGSHDARQRIAIHNGERVGLRATDGLIAEIGPDVFPQPGDYLIDAAGAILVAPLINGHTHAAMTLFRGYGDDLPLTAANPRPATPVTPEQLRLLAKPAGTR